MVPRLQKNAGVHAVDLQRLRRFPVHSHRPAVPVGDGQGQQPGLLQADRTGKGAARLGDVLQGGLAQGSHVLHIVRHRQADHLEVIKVIGSGLCEGDLTAPDAGFAVAQVVGHPVPPEVVQGVLLIDNALFGHRVAGNPDRRLLFLLAVHGQVVPIDVGLRVRRPVKAQGDGAGTLLHPDRIVFDFRVLGLAHRPGNVLGGQPGLLPAQDLGYPARIRILHHNALQNCLLPLQGGQFLIV